MGTIEIMFISTSVVNKSFQKANLDNNLLQNNVFQLYLKEVLEEYQQEALEQIYRNS